MKTFENAQVGDRVWSLLYGHLTIREINKSNNFSIVCEDGDFMSQMTFDLDGYNRTIHKNPSLFWEEQKLNFNTERSAPEINWSKVPVDTKVLAINTDGEFERSCLRTSDSMLMIRPARRRN